MRLTGSKYYRDIENPIAISSRNFYLYRGYELMNKMIENNVPHWGVKAQKE